MRVHVLQHVAFEGLGSIESWLAAHGATVSYTQFFLESAVLPDLAEIDGLIILGGPMSVHDTVQYPWLLAESAFVARAIQAEKRVLGICLGAQLIAHSLGAKVYPNAQKEIGWFPITGLPLHAEVFNFPASTTVFHWHGETFELPSGAVHLAQSVACLHQAYQVGRHVIGLQFHLETTAQSADAIINHCGDELVDLPYVQSEASLRSAPPSHYQTVNALMAEVLGYVFQP